jgi:ligand-binding SRPBCC domain-containing protein
MHSMTQRFETRQWVPFPVELAFAFFANPANLPHLMPPQLKMRVEDARLQPPPARPLASDPARRFRGLAAGEGSEILVSFQLLWGLPRLSSMVRITEFGWNSHFRDEQVRGPFAALRHRHGFAAEARDGEEGTLVTDEIEYELPGGVLGRIAEPLVRRRFERVFAYRQVRLPEVLAAASRQAMRRE